MKRLIARYILSGEIEQDLAVNEGGKIVIKNPRQDGLVAWGLKIRFKETAGNSLINIKPLGQGNEITFGPTQLSVLGEAADNSDSKIIPMEILLSGTQELEFSLTARVAIGKGDVALSLLCEDTKRYFAKPNDSVQTKPATGGG